MYIPPHACIDIPEETRQGGVRKRKAIDVSASEARLVLEAFFFLVWLPVLCSLSLSFVSLELYDRLLSFFSFFSVDMSRQLRGEEGSLPSCLPRRVWGTAFWKRHAKKGKEEEKEDQENEKEEREERCRDREKLSVFLNCMEG